MNEVGLQVLRERLGSTRLSCQEATARRDALSEQLAKAEQRLAAMDAERVALEEALASVDDEFSPGASLPATTTLMGWY
jgi:cell division protein FtsB